jgi:hypothetical protein
VMGGGAHLLRAGPLAGDIRAATPHPGQGHADSMRGKAWRVQHGGEANLSTRPVPRQTSHETTPLPLQMKQVPAPPVSTIQNRGLV